MSNMRIFISATWNSGPITPTAKDEASNRLDAQEARRRFEMLVRTALNTATKPMKDVACKRPVPEGQAAQGC